MARRLARQAETDGIDKVFEAAEAAAALMEQAQPLLAQASELVEQLTPLLAELRAGGLVSVCVCVCVCRWGGGGDGARPAVSTPAPVTRHTYAHMPTSAQEWLWPASTHQ